MKQQQEWGDAVQFRIYIFSHTLIFAYLVDLLPQFIEEQINCPKANHSTDNSAQCYISFLLAFHEIFTILKISQMKLSGFGDKTYEYGTTWLPLHAFTLCI
jgi:hypothetical protein